MPDEPLGPEHGLRFDWQLAKLHLDARFKKRVEASPPRLSKPSRSKIASLASFAPYLDAANDLIIQRNA